MSDILTELSGNVLRVQLHRPAKKNAMTASMYTTLAGILTSAAKDEHVHSILWHGAGDLFCAGNDVQDFIENPPAHPPVDSHQAVLMKAFVALDKPLVAAVHGAAVGGGATMLLHCDFVYAAAGTKFVLPFIDLALCPEFGSSYTLPARLGYLRAAELLLLGQPFDAAQAADYGIVTQVLDAPDVLGKATETAQKLAAKPPAAMRTSKRLMRQSTQSLLMAAIEAENEQLAARVRSPESQEIFASFLRKRAAAGASADAAAPRPNG